MEHKYSNILQTRSTNVGSIERLASVLAGAWLLANTFTSRKPSLVSAAAGGYLLFRGSTGYCPILEGLGKKEVDYRTPNINIKTAVTINKPRHSVYAFWRKLDNLPRCMKHLESVREIDHHRSQWRARLPGGFGTVTWDSEIVIEEPGEFLSWQSISDRGIKNAGKIEFRDAGKFGTELYFVISYHAPLGILGEKTARLLNPMLENTIREAIKNFKRYIETGEVPTVEGQSSGRRQRKAITEPIENQPHL